MRILHLVLVLTVIAPLSRAHAQEAPPPAHQHPGSEPPQNAWSWTSDANLFFGYNYQQRKFTDFSVWESQNWFMLAGQRRVGRGELTVDGMLSLEPFTLEALGSPQVFQTGEHYRGGPLIDYQHPHDLLMGLGATYRVVHRGVGYVFEADLVGPPALGPTTFMHRESARNNPEAPLTHHYLDSTHATPGVVRAGIKWGGLVVDGSWFRGREPDDNRLNIDRPWLDSWSLRTSWQRGPWQAQVSGARLQRPEFYSYNDMTRLTASIIFTGTLGSRPTAATLAWGENREVHGILDGYLLEWDVQMTPRGSLYGRLEAAAKDLLDLGGLEPPGFVQFHRISHVGAFTLGYLREISQRSWGRVGLGGDLTVYHVPENMLEYYGAPHSFHVFLRYRPSIATSMRHRH